MKKLLFLVFAICLTVSAEAQLAENGPSSIPPGQEVVPNDWVFHYDQEHGTLYIDLSKMGGEALFLDVRSNEESALLRREDLEGIPSDVIYELDLLTFGKGTFIVEVATTKSVARQTVESPGPK